MESIKIASFNCKGLSSARSEVVRLCDSYSIVCVQEHWLFPYDISSLCHIHVNFRGTGVSAMDPSQQVFTGRPYGGVGILWHKQIDNLVSSVETGENWMSCIKVKIADSHMFVVSVYLPYEKRDHDDDYVACLAKLESFIAECDSSVVYILGDFNADAMKNTSFSKHLIDYVERTSCIFSDYYFIDEGFTYVSDAWGTTSWLDHCLTTELLQMLVFCMIILLLITNR